MRVKVLCRGKGRGEGGRRERGEGEVAGGLGRPDALYRERTGPNPRPPARPTEKRGQFETRTISLSSLRNRNEKKEEEG